MICKKKYIFLIVISNYIITSEMGFQSLHRNKSQDDLFNNLNAIRRERELDYAEQSGIFNKLKKNNDDQSQCLNHYEPNEECNSYNSENSLCSQKEDNNTVNIQHSNNDQEQNNEAVSNNDKGKDNKEGKTYDKNTQTETVSKFCCTC